MDATGDQEAALSAIGLTEIIHGLYRAKTPAVRLRRESFLNVSLADIAVYPYTRETATLAGKIDGEQQGRGVVIPFADLLIGATALSLGYSVLTSNPRAFRRIPGLSVVQFCAKATANHTLQRLFPNQELPFLASLRGFRARHLIGGPLCTVK